MANASRGSGNRPPRWARPHHGRQPGERQRDRHPDGAAIGHAHLQQPLPRRGRRVLQEGGSQGQPPHHRRGRLGQRRHRRQRRLHHRQRLLAFLNLVDKPLVELVLRKDVATAAGVNAQQPLAERAKALKGRTIAIQGVGSIVHAWQRLVTARGGLDIEKDVRIAPMDPPGMLAALDSKQIDGYATSMPFTTEAVVRDKAVMLASAVRDAPDLLPFAYALVYTRPDMCTKQREKCARVARAFIAANRFIHDKPDEAFALLKKRFDKMDPNLLAAAWQVASQAHTTDLSITVPSLDHSQKVSLESKLLEPKDALTRFEGLYTNEFVQ